MNPNRKHLVVVAGPTAVGKTAAAITVARNFNTAIISADSRQCYREMTIGTAKPNAAELAAVPHYFINTHSVIDALSAADYELLALAYAQKIFQEKNVAVVCGGTGLYLKALCEGIDFMPTTDTAVEQAVKESYQQNGLAWLQEATASEDPEFFKQAEQQNPHRLLRALSFKRSTGQSILNYRNHRKKERPFQVHKFALNLPRTQLYERINNRVETMMRDGLLDEVKGLLPYRHLKNLQTVGYSELFQYLDGHISLAEAIDLIKQHSRNYAKRQITWFKKDPEYQWLTPEDTSTIIEQIESTP